MFEETRVHPHTRQPPVSRPRRPLYHFLPWWCGGHQVTTLPGKRQFLHYQGKKSHRSVRVLYRRTKSEEPSFDRFKHPCTRCFGSSVHSFGLPIKIDKLPLLASCISHSAQTEGVGRPPAFAPSGFSCQAPRRRTRYRATRCGLRITSD